MSRLQATHDAGVVAHNVQAVKLLLELVRERADTLLNEHGGTKGCHRVSAAQTTHRAKR